MNDGSGRMTRETHTIYLDYTAHMPACRQALDAFVEALEKIYDEIFTTAQLVHDAPHNQTVSRIDEVSAARQPNLRW